MKIKVEMDDGTINELKECESAVIVTVESGGESCETFVKTKDGDELTRMYLGLGSCIYNNIME